MEEAATEEEARRVGRRAEVAAATQPDQAGRGNSRELAGRKLR